MAEAPDRLSTPLLVAAILCVVIGLFPQGGWRTSVSDYEVTITEWTLGFSFSPIWTYTKRQGPYGWSEKSGLQFLSWSWIPIGVGAALLEVWARRRRKRKVLNKTNLEGASQ